MKDNKIDERKIPVISYGGLESKGFYSDHKRVSFTVSPDYYDSRSKVRFEYSYYDRTVKLKFSGSIKSLHSDGLEVLQIIKIPTRHRLTAKPGVAMYARVSTKDKQDVQMELRRWAKKDGL